MKVSIRELRDHISNVVAAVQAGASVTPTRRGEPIGPHRQPARWLPSGWLGEQLAARQTDPALRADLGRLAGGTIDEL